MNQYFVIQIRDECQPIAYRNMQRGERDQGVATIYAHNEATWGEITRNSSIFSTDTLTEAQQLAKFLCARYVGNKYIICTANSMYFTDPGTVQVANFTEHGLLPE